MKKGKERIQDDPCDRQPSPSLSVKQTHDSQYCADPRRQHKQHKCDDSLSKCGHARKDRLGNRPEDQEDNR